MIRTIIFWMVFSVQIFFFLASGFILSLFFDKGRVHRKMLVILARIQSWVAGVKLSVFGQENIPKEGNVIFVCNHQSAIDALVVLRVLPRDFRFVIMQQIFDIPVLTDLFKKAGYVPVDLSNPKEALISMRRATSILRWGESIIIFPEGTRSPDGRLQEFKDGAAMLILQAEVPVVPLAISGAYKVMQKEDLYGLRVRAGQIKLNIGKPMVFPRGQEVSVENAHRLSVEIKGTIQKLLEGRI